MHARLVPSPVACIPVALARRTQTMASAGYRRNSCHIRFGRGARDVFTWPVGGGSVGQRSHRDASGRRTLGVVHAERRRSLSAQPRRIANCMARPDECTGRAARIVYQLPRFRHATRPPKAVRTPELERATCDLGWRRRARVTRVPGFLAARGGLHRKPCTVGQVAAVPQTSRPRLASPGSHRPCFSSDSSFCYVRIGLGRSWMHVVVVRRAAQQEGQPAVTRLHMRGSLRLRDAGSIQATAYPSRWSAAAMARHQANARGSWCSFRSGASRPCK